MGSDSTIEMTVTFAGVGVAFVPLVQAAVVDIRTRRLPDRLVLPGAASIWRVMRGWRPQLLSCSFYPAAVRLRDLEPSPWREGGPRR